MQRHSARQKGNGRRRATLHARKDRAGYMQLRSHDLLDLDACPILVPALKRAPDIARALGRDRGFTFEGPRQMFDELREASRGGVVDYFGITWEKVEQNYGVFWPCPDLDHPGTLRLFEPGSWNPVAKGNMRSSSAMRARRRWN